MGSLHQSGQFVRGNESHIACASPPDNYHLAIVNHLIENRRKFVAQIGIGCFDGHDFIVQVSCTLPCGRGD
jgi:hypothetical protein